MRLKNWDQLPEEMKNEAVKKYYNKLSEKKFSLFIKRIIDVILAIVLIILLLPLIIFIAIAIKIDSKGPIFFRQVRVTQYGKKFKIIKFRTMVNSVENIEVQVTTKNDKRITRIGRFLRKIRFDEIPQLFNVIVGDMSFVGTRPEVVRFVEQYTNEMMATLLLPSGITSLTSIMFKDEENLLQSSNDIDKTYTESILPEKMKLNLLTIENFSIREDFRIILKTIFAVLLKNLKGR